ncbi:hypothetical protein HAX54_035668 [Datura stramonium]|uniref:Uncharacterized protein n=1 Tax=Datura stramonium TaxID=4076 RepID=A0ABS8VH45_DATST|nr:hypothetical protein [Datura stramonium]
MILGIGCSLTSLSREAIHGISSLHFGKALLVASCIVHLSSCSILYTLNFFFLPYLQEHVSFQRAQHMIIGAVCRINLCTSFTALSSHQEYQISNGILSMLHTKRCTK